MSTISNYEDARRNLDIVESAQGDFSQAHYNRILAAATRQCEAAQDALFEGRE